MSDLVERLRRCHCLPGQCLRHGTEDVDTTCDMHQAADRIEALEKALREIYDMDAPKRGFPPNIERVEGPFARIARAALNGDKT